MGRQSSPDRAKAKEMFLSSQGKLTNREIGKALGVDERKIAVWKQRDKWKVVQQKNKSCTTKQKRDKTTAEKRRVIKKDVPSEEPALTEKQILFCLYYLKLRNVTMAAIKAGYSKMTAHVAGSRLLKNVKVREYLDKLREEMRTEIFLEAADVIQEYMKIAFADITDYVIFGQKEVQAMGAFGPIYDGEGEEAKPVMKIINYVDFKESDEIDGTLISEVKQGRDGVSIKFHDKMKAMEKLEKYLDLLPDQHKRMIENEKLRIEQDRLTLDKGKVEGGGPEETVDDGFIDALKAEAVDVWAGERDE